MITILPNPAIVVAIMIASFLNKAVDQYLSTEEPRREGILARRVSGEGTGPNKKVKSKLNKDHEDV